VIKLFHYAHACIFMCLSRPDLRVVMPACVFVHGYVCRQICIAGVPSSFILVYVICIYMHTCIYIYKCRVYIHSCSYIDMYTLYTFVPQSSTYVYK